MTIDAASLPPVLDASKSATDVPVDLNELLKQEVAAGEVYRLAAAHGGPERSAHAYRGVMTQIQEEHELAADAIRQLMADSQSQPAERSGTWGHWTPAVHRCSNAGADSQLPPLLECLLDGEQQLLETYLTGSAGLPEEVGKFMTGQLVPAQQRHVRMLRLLIGDAE